MVIIFIILNLRIRILWFCYQRVENRLVCSNQFVVPVIQPLCLCVSLSVCL
jgi:hypothetical protein